MEFLELDEYKKDVKKLLKKYRTLKDDIEVVKKVLIVNPDAHPPFSYEIDGLRIENIIIKVKKIACKTMKGKGAQSGIRLVYTHNKENETITLIELYYKGDKEVEDKDRIKQYFT